MSTSHESPRPRKAGLPLELYRSIFIFANTRDLCNVCITSRAIAKEAERILYGDVDLRDSKLSRVSSWARAVAARPALAEMLLFLCLPSSDKHHFSAEWISETSRSLKNCINLKEITIRANENRNNWFPLFDLSVFDGCSFRLQKLHYPTGIIIIGGSLIDFVAKQPDIRDLTIQGLMAHGNAGLIQYFPPHILPNLSTVTILQYPGETPLVTKSIGIRPIQHICLKISMEIPRGEFEAIWKNLQPAEATLTHLSLILRSNSSIGNGLTFISIAVTFADRFPRLKFLCIHSHLEKKFVSIHSHCYFKFNVLTTYFQAHQWDTVIDMLSTLKYLETFILRPLQEFNCTGPSSTAEKDCLPIAQQLVECCPSLCNVSLALDDSSKAVLRSYSKSKDGQVVFQGIDVVQKSFWWPDHE